MISLADIQRNTMQPPRLVVYGVPGIGKTTLAASSPNPIFIAVEDGLGTLDVPAFPRPTCYEDVLGALRALETESHDYESVWIDSLDRLEPMIWDFVCRRDGKDNIEAYGYGKGYTAALGEWRVLLDRLDALRDRGMLVGAVAHSTVVQFDPPDSDSYSRYQMRLHKLAEAAVCDWADAVLFATEQVVAVNAKGKADTKRRIGHSSGDRVLYTTERAAWRAKNRYRMPDVLPLDWAAVQNAIGAAASGIARADVQQPGDTETDTDTDNVPETDLQTETETNQD